MNILLYALNVICSAGQSTLSKQYASCGGNANVYNINKTSAGLLIFLTVGLFSGIRFHAPTFLLGIGYGAALCVSNFAGFTALSMGPMALTSIIASFSLIIPFAVGITVWGEPLSVWGVIGIVFLISSIVLLNYQKSTDRISLKWTFYSFLTFFANGVCSLIQKQHQTDYPGSYRTEFMVSAMLSVLVLLLVTVLIRRETKATVKFCPQGAVAGLTEGVANYIVLYLAATENASVLFPVVSVAKIIAVWIIGRIVFRERLKIWQMVGLVAGIVAIALLNIR